MILIPRPLPIWQSWRWIASHGLAFGLIMVSLNNSTTCLPLQYYLRYVHSLLTFSFILYFPLSGSHDDVVAELNTFGIGTNLLTFDPRSEESAMVIREWFANRRLKEANARAAAASRTTAPSGGVVTEIAHYDVLFGT